MCREICDGAGQISCQISNVHDFGYNWKKAHVGAGSELYLEIPSNHHAQGKICTEHLDHSNLCIAVHNEAPYNF